jgi:hypothetical protein
MKRMFKFGGKMGCDCDRLNERSHHLRGLGLDARQADIPIGCNEFVCKLAD